MAFVLSGAGVMAQSDADFQKGKEYHEKYMEARKRGNYAAAFKYAKKSAALNNPRGLSDVGICYEAGYGTAPDYEQARIWYKKAMEHPEDHFAYTTGFWNISKHYMKGRGIPKDFAKGARILSESINNLIPIWENNPSEQDEYAFLFKHINEYYSAKEINSNKDLAYTVDFLEAKGYGDTHQDFPFKRSFEMRSDFAIEKVKAIAENGNKEARAAWAKYLYLDKAKQEDKREAVSLFENTSDLTLSQDMLIVAKGDGYYDKSLPTEWYMRKDHIQELYTASENGNREAQFTRAVEYDMKSNSSRMTWYEKASAQGHELATKRLTDLKNEQAAAEAAAKKERELAAKQEAERKALDLALKKNCEGKQITWTETMTLDTGSGSIGQAILDAFGGSVLHEVNYTVVYTAIVEKVIGDENVKCIVKRAEIKDPRFASANYLKYRKYAQAEASEAIGKTRVLEMNEFKLK